MVSVKMIIPDDAELKKVIRAHLLDVTRNIIQDMDYDFGKLQEVVRKHVNKKFEAESYWMKSKIEKMIREKLDKEFDETTFAEKYDIKKMVENSIDQKVEREVRNLNRLENIYLEKLKKKMEERE